MTNVEKNEYVEKRRVLPNDYDSSAAVTGYYEENTSRKLSSISEKTDESESDLSRSRYMQPKPRGYTTTIVRQNYPPTLPMIKSRRRIIREDNDDENDSGTLLFIQEFERIFFFFSFRC